MRIDSCDVLRRFSRESSRRPCGGLMLCMEEEWRRRSGRGICVGLLDGAVHTGTPDLQGAELVAKSFVASQQPHSRVAEHGSHSAAILVGQGCHTIRGIAPRIRLLVASVFDANGVASPQSVAEAIHWVVSSAAQIVVLPLGQHTGHPHISQAIERGSLGNGVLFFAAAGNRHPEPILFPARHPLAIAVGAADVKGNLLPECCRLPRLDLIAPGWNVYAPIGAHAIRRRSGSSVACVVAAGVAALALSAGVSSAPATGRSAMLAVLRRGSSQDSKVASVIGSHARESRSRNTTQPGPVDVHRSATTEQRQRPMYTGR